MSKIKDSDNLLILGAKRKNITDNEKDKEINTLMLPATIIFNNIK